MEIEKDRELIRVLWDDVESSISELNEISSASKDFGFKARSYLRAYASWLEGGVFLFKKMLANLKGDIHKRLTIESQLYLFNYDWKISNGVPELSYKRIATKDNIKAFFKVSAQIFEDYKPDFKSDGWNGLMFFYRLRDRIMHPKEIADLSLDMEDLKRCEAGREWVKKELSDIKDCLLRDYKNV